MSLFVKFEQEAALDQLPLYLLDHLNYIPREIAQWSLCTRLKISYERSKTLVEFVLINYEAIVKLVVLDN